MTTNPLATTGLEIRHEKNKSSGRYVIDLAPGKVAEMTYQRHNLSKISIDHTRVPPEFRGRNIAEKLMEYAISQARRNKDRIVPVCSYVQKQFARHPNWSDLLTE